MSRVVRAASRSPAPAGRKAVVALFVLVVALPTACAPADEEPLRIGAAAVLMPVLDELTVSFEAASGHPVVVTYASSGQLAQQLLEGAPMDLYLSADVGYVEQVLAGGVGDPGSQTTYAYGRLVLWSLADGRGWDDLDALEDLDDLAAAVSAGHVGSVSIANPNHAPYGRAAREALRAAGAWETVEPHLVLGENVADAFRLAASGNVDVAITPASMARVSDEGDGGAEGRWVEIDDDLHARIEQDLVVTAEDADRVALAERFVDHLLGDDGRATLQRFGLQPPDPAAEG